MLNGITQHNNLAAIENRRTGRSPLVCGVVVFAGVNNAEVLLPQEVAVTAVAVQAFGPQQYEDVLAVRSGSRRCVTVMRMAVDLRYTFVERLLPKDFSADALE